MDIKRMHSMIEKLTEVACCEFDKGIENINVEEMGEATDMMKDLAEAMYYRTLTKVMDESDSEEILAMMERHGDRRHYDHYRYADGRFAPKGRGTRRGYDEPPYYHMDPEWDRDMDRHDGKMHYTDTGMNRTEMKESNYDRAKRHYTETKDMHKADTPEDKQKKMESLDSYMKEITGDVTKLMHDMTAEEKNLLRNKLSTLVSKI